MRKVLLLIMMLTATTLTWAQTLSGKGTETDPYLIQNDTDWETFAGLINSASTNSSYRYKYYKQTADINVTTMVGTSGSYSFRGYYDGDGHTMNISLTSTGSYCAPFKYVNYGGVFRRLHITGTITTSGPCAGSLVGNYDDGTLKVINCWSSVTINSSTEQTYTSSHGGFVGINYDRINFTNCRFDGSLLGSNPLGFGGFVGHQHSTDGFTTISNCLFAPTALTSNTTECYTFVRSTNVEISNGYYTEAFGTVQGTAVGSMTNAQLQETLGVNWEIANNKVTPVMDIKNLTPGSITCNTFIPYTGSEITVTPTVKDMDGHTLDAANYNVSFSPSPVQAIGDYTMTVTGNTANGYSGTLTHDFRVAQHLSGSGTYDDPFIVASTDDWNIMAAAVAGGINYYNQYLSLTDDITVSTMVGSFGDYPFSGIFYGNNHTITANIVSTTTGDDLNDQGVAPFHCTSGATIRNLTVAGTISSNSKYAAGLVGLLDKWNYLYDCVVTATITTGDDYAGGLVGFAGPNTSYSNNHSHFTNCVFAGTIQSNSSDQRIVGGINGTSSCNVYYDNCLENGTYNNISLMNPRGICDYYSMDEVTSLYYVNKIGHMHYCLADDYGCHQVYKTAPTDVMYLTRNIKGYTVYHPVRALLKDVYAYNNGNAVALDYVLKNGKANMTEGTDYEVSYSPAAPAAIGEYTITFTAKDGNTTGFVGSTVGTFRVIEGEDLDGYVFATEGEGDEKVYLINDESDLKRLAAYVSSNHDATGLTFKLNDNITLNEEHTPIGGLVNQFYRAFRGTFDGNSKTIYNLTINKPLDNCQGLFGYVGAGAVIKDVTLTNCNITGKMYAGGIVGHMNGSGSPITINNCHVNGTIAATESLAPYHGGIVGYSDNVNNITNCTVSGTISTVVANHSYGGILGVGAGAVHIESCENTATITGPGEDHGGILGYCTSTNGNIRHNFNRAILEGTSRVGSIIGYTEYYYYNMYADNYYAEPSNYKAFGAKNLDESRDSDGHGQRAYTVTAGEHLESITSAETVSFVSTLNGKNYYKAGNWTLTLTPALNNETFITYNCVGGTLTNLTTMDGEHTLTITDQHVTISAVVSDNAGIDIDGATIAPIADQRWRSTFGCTPVPTVTYGGTPLTLDTDYILTWADNTAISEGTATVTLIGINGYKGTKTATFNIVDFPLLTPGDPNSATNPYLVADEADIQALACIVNSGARNNGYYKQTENITLTQEHTPIGIFYNSGDDDYKFNGTYDGDNKTINGLVINNPTGDNQGLFGYANTESGSHTTIKNVNIVNCSITGNYCTGGVLGYGKIVDIINCTVSGTIVGTNYYLGGIAGEIYGNSWDGKGSISDCTNNASVNGTTSVGGIVGNMDYCTLTNNTNTGSVTGENYIGGVAGSANSTTRTGNFNAGIVTATGTDYIGSLFGRAVYGSMSNNYYLTGLGSISGVGDGSATGSDQEGAEIVATITAGEGVTLELPDTPTKEWNSQNYYKSGTAVTLDYDLPSGKFFNIYTVNSGVISNPGVQTGSHTLTGFRENVTISGSYVDSQIDITTAVIASIADLTYNGQVQHPAPVVTLNDEVLVENTNYTLSYSDGCTNVNDALAPYTVTVTGLGAYVGSISTNFNITAFDISGNNAVAVTGLYNQYLQTGSAVHPVPASVMCAATNNATLVLGTDYNITYSEGCTEPGNYQIMLTGMGNYKGTKVIDFAILNAWGLTVHDGASNNSMIPINGSWCDAYQKNEILMHSSELSIMNGKGITQMWFYLKNKATSVWNGTFKVFLKEVTNESAAGQFLGMDGATVVYEGSLDGQNDVMNIVFTTPYVYHGGNLLIGIYKTTKNNWSTASFYGENASYYASNHAYGSNSLDDITVPSTTTQFVPKTTFVYTDQESTTVSGYTAANDGWMFIASPLVDNVNPTYVTNLIDATTPANYDLFRFNQAGTTGEWENYKTHTEGFMLENGKGYLYARSSAATVSYTGTLNVAASKTVNLDYDENAQFAGWNLIGNPFNTTANIGQAYYKMNADGSDIVAEEGSVDIAACTGVMVRATAINQSVTFTKTGAKSAGENRSMHITLTKGGTRGEAVQDKAIVSFNNESKLSKFIFNKDNAKLFIPQDGEDYAVTYSDRSGVMPLNFEAKEIGSYTISFDANNTVLNGIHLIDKANGTDIDLSVNNSYKFIGSPYDNAERFEIVFGGAANEIFAYQNDDQIIVNGQGELQIFDLMGRLVTDMQVDGSKHINAESFRNAVYIFRLVGETTRTQKIVVK